jgi:hypothetical protein
VAAEKFVCAGTATVAASTTSANTALPTVGESCVIFNATNGIAFVRFGTDNTVAASSAIDFPVPPGTRAILGCVQLPARSISPADPARNTDPETRQFQKVPET